MPSPATGRPFGRTFIILTLPWWGQPGDPDALSGGVFQSALLRLGSFEKYGDSRVRKGGHPDGLPPPFAFLVEGLDCGRHARRVGGHLEGG